jgi:hypothetical protein
MKIQNSQLYAAFVAGRAGPDLVLDYIRETASGREFLTDNYGIVLEIQINVCQSRNVRVDDLIKAYEAKANDNNLGQQERARATAVVDLVRKFPYRSLESAPGCLNYLVQKIDLVSRFDT